MGCLVALFFIPEPMQESLGLLIGNLISPLLFPAIQKPEYDQWACAHIDEAPSPGWRATGWALGGLALTMVTILMIVAVEIASHLWSFVLIEEARVAEDHDRVIALCTEAIGNDFFSDIFPLLADLYEFRGEAHTAQDKYQSAISDLETALKLDPSPKEAVAVYESLGDVYRYMVHREDSCYDLEAVQNGIDAYQKALRLYPGRYWSHRGIGLLLRHQGRHDESVEELRRAVELRETAASVSNMAESMLYAGDYEGAVTELGRALSLDSSRAGTYSWLGFAYLIGEDLQRSEEHYATYRRLEEEPDTYATIHHAIVLRRLGRDNEAESLLAEQRLGVGDNEWQHGLLSFHLGELDERGLLDLANDGCRLCEGQLYIGYRYFIENRSDQALPLLRQAIPSCPPCYMEILISLSVLERLSSG
jgi:tetratricopeptide (TPR) repeat protein